MIEKLYFCVSCRKGDILATTLRRGRFLNYKHFVGLITHWCGTAGEMEYFYYPARDRDTDLPPLEDFTAQYEYMAR